MKKKILVIDDENDVLLTIKDEFEFLGHDVTTLNDPDLVEHHLSENDYDLILLDIMMPKINGLDLIEVIRAKTQVKIIIVSAIGEVMKADPAMNDVSMIIDKPFEFDDIKKVLDDAA